MTIGFFGEPSKPIVDAMGMPVSMCVAWISPLESESRIAAQLAPLITVELMPYFLNRPFSCATTTGEQSVSAIITKRRSVVSGPSPADQATRLERTRDPASSAAAPPTKRRREIVGRGDLMQTILSGATFPTLF